MMQIKHQLNTTTKHTEVTMSRNKSWLIIPLFIFTKYENGKYEIIIGWLTKALTITFGKDE